MIKATAKQVENNPHMTDMPKGSRHFRVTLRNTATGKRATFAFSQGPAHEKEPTARIVLECLLSDASCAEYSFEEFCSNCGYDTDSRKAERTHKAIKANAARLVKLLGSIPEGDSEELARALTED